MMPPSLIRLLLTLLLFIGTSIGGSAQSVCYDDKAISTDPARASNPEFPAKRNIDPVLFDWMSDHYRLKVDFLRDSTVRSPFFDYGTSDFVFSTHRAAEHGWELVKQEMGIPFDSPTAPFVSSINVPVLILYNRYTAVLRVFFYFDTGDRNFPAADRLRLWVRFNMPPGSITPSTLDLATSTRTEPVRPLDRFVPEPFFARISAFYWSRPQWVYADFPMMYDPCTCISAATFSIGLDYVDEPNIFRTTTGWEQVYSPFSSDRLEISHEANVALGTRPMANAPSLATWSFQSPLHLRTIARGTFTRARQVDSSLPADLQLRFSEGWNQRTIALDSVTRRMQRPGFLETPLADDPYVTGAVENMAYLTAMGVRQKNRQEWLSEPMAITSSDEYVSTYSIASTPREVSVHVPGSFHDRPEESPDVYPYYNEPLGIFNLLTTPTVLAFRTSNAVAPATDTVMLRVDKVPEYAVNVAAGFDPAHVDVQAALVLESDTPLIGEGSTLLAGNPDVEIVSDRMIRTRYVPIGCLPNVTASFSRTLWGPVASGTVGSFPSLSGLRATIRIVARLVIRDKPADVHNVLFVARYPVQVVPVGASERHRVAHAGVSAECAAAGAPVGRPRIEAFCASQAYLQGRRSGEQPSETEAGFPLPEPLATLSVRPNPAIDYIVVRCMVSTDGPATFTIMDALGQQHITIQHEVRGGVLLDAPIDVGSLAPGWYTLQVASGITRQSIPISIQR